MFVGVEMGINVIIAVAPPTILLVAGGAAMSAHAVWPFAIECRGSLLGQSQSNLDGFSFFEYEYCDPFEIKKHNPFGNLLCLLTNVKHEWGLYSSHKA